MSPVQRTEALRTDGTTAWDEYQAIVRRPASLLDPDWARALGYVLTVGPIALTAEQAEKLAEQNSEETLSSVVGMRWRTVTAEAWVEVER